VADSEAQPSATSIFVLVDHAAAVNVPTSAKPALGRLKTFSFKQIAFDESGAPAASV
jgi:hypothetical protein